MIAANNQGLGEVGAEVLETASRVSDRTGLRCCITAV